MLIVKKIDSYYDIVHVLFDLSLSVRKGESVALLGRNGTGKTTCLRSIMGIVPISTGSITFQEKEIGKLEPYQIARLGVGFVPEGRRIFGNLTVRENLMMGKIMVREGAGISKWDEARCYELFPVLEKLRYRKGDQLSGGEQQMLTIARTLMGNPIFIILDEPCEGLSPIIKSTVQDQLDKLKREEITILLAGQDVKLAMDIAARVYFIDKGVIEHVSSSEDLRQDDSAIRKYMEL